MLKLSLEDGTMSSFEGTCPLSQQQLVDEYFIEVRAKLLDVAAFLDRLERSTDQNAAQDFRLLAMQEALEALSARTPQRVQTIQMIFSDPNTELLPELDRKSAFGAFNHHKEEAR
jgi:hypothetical protein